jgi:hypothetical protein
VVDDDRLRHGARFAEQADLQKRHVVVAQRGLMVRGAAEW